MILTISSVLWLAGLLGFILNMDKCLSLSIVIRTVENEQKKRYRPGILSRSIPFLYYWGQEAQSRFYDSAVRVASRSIRSVKFSLVVSSTDTASVVIAPPKNT